MQMCLPVPFSKSITTTAPRIAWLTRRSLSSRSSGPMKHRFQGHPLLHGRHRHGNLPIYILYCLKCPKKTDNSKWSHKHIDMIPDVRSASPWHGRMFLPGALELWERALRWSLNLLVRCFGLQTHVFALEYTSWYGGQGRVTKQSRPDGCVRDRVPICLCV